jgi:hypothetical protein
VLLTLLVLPTLIFQYKSQKKQKQQPRHVSIITKHHVGRMQTRDIWQVQNQTRAGFIARNEMDTHADMCCAGSNWSLMELTGEVCDVNPFLNSYDPVTEIPVARCCMVWTDQESSTEYLIVADQMLWFVTLMENSLINPNQLRA